MIEIAKRMPSVEVDLQGLIDDIGRAQAKGTNIGDCIGPLLWAYVPVNRLITGIEFYESTFNAISCMGYSHDVMGAFNQKDGVGDGFIEKRLEEAKNIAKGYIVIASLGYMMDVVRESDIRDKGDILKVLEDVRRVVYSGEEYPIRYAQFAVRYAKLIENKLPEGIQSGHLDKRTQSEGGYISLPPKVAACRLQ